MSPTSMTISQISKLWAVPLPTVYFHIRKGRFGTIAPAYPTRLQLAAVEAVYGPANRKQLEAVLSAPRRASRVL